MSLKEQLEKQGATPGKLALIGVLSVVLAVVVIRQLPSTEEPVALAAQTTAKPTQSQRKEGDQVADKASAADEQSPPWPEFELEETLAHNPFRPPHWAALPEALSPTEANTPGLLSQMKQKGVSILIIGEGQKTATVGEQRLRVGDVLEGYQVTDITTQGIVLNKAGSN